MVGLGETDEEIVQVLHDMRAHDIDMLTIGQYLAPRPATRPCSATSRLSSSRRWKNGHAGFSPRGWGHGA